MRFEMFLYLISFTNMYSEDFEPKWFKIGYCVSCSCYRCPTFVLPLFVFSILFAVFCVVGELNYGICITCVYCPVNCLPCITYITFWKLYKTWCMPLEMFWNVNVVPVCCIYVFVIFLCCITLYIMCLYDSCIYLLNICVTFVCCISV